MKEYEINSAISALETVLSNVNTHTYELETNNGDIFNKCLEEYEESVLKEALKILSSM